MMYCFSLVWCSVVVESGRVQRKNRLISSLNTSNTDCVAVAEAVVVELDAAVAVNVDVVGDNVHGERGDGNDWC